MESRRQLGLLWGGVALALVLVSPLGPYLAQGLPACPLKTWTHLPCPACGTTRAALALAHFDLPGALAVSPLATLGWVALVGGGLVAGLAALMGLGVPEPRGPLPLAWRLGGVGVLLANWVYLVWHGS